jgi:hypothetical protein
VCLHIYIHHVESIVLCLIFPPTRFSFRFLSLLSTFLLSRALSSSSSLLRHIVSRACSPLLIIMVNVTYSEVSGDPTYYMADGTPVLYNLGDMAWMLTSTALVFLMIPGVGLLYSGLLRRKNALSMLLISFLAIAVGSFQWFL